MYGQSGSRGDLYNARHSSGRGVGGDGNLGVSGGTSRGFFQSLFDFSFSYFVAPKLVRLAYVFAVLVLGLLAAGGLLLGLARGGGTAVAALILIPLVFLAWTAFVRISLEILIVVFRIAEPIRDAAASLDELTKLTERAGSGAAQPSTVKTGGGSPGEDLPSEKGPSQPTTEAAEKSSGEHAFQRGSAMLGHIASEGHRFCTRCGEQNSIENKFCFSCGTNLE